MAQEIKASSRVKLAFSKQQTEWFVRSKELKIFKSVMPKQPSWNSIFEKAVFLVPDTT